MNYFDHLKKKWNIKSNRDVLVICIVFSLAGMLIIHERKPIFHLFGITKETALWIKICVYLPVVFPLYQINLLIFGFLLGQFSFFWEKEKAMARFIARQFAGNKQIQKI